MKTIFQGHLRSQTDIDSLKIYLEDPQALYKSWIFWQEKWSVNYIS